MTDILAAIALVAALAVLVFLGFWIPAHWDEQ